jgi:hypothetical protein
MQTGHHRTVKVVTGSDAFILTGADDQKDIDALTHLGEQEFRLTITLHWEEYRQPTQPAGSLWLEYQLGTTTPEPPGIEAVVPIVTPGPECKTFLIVTLGDVSVHYTGQANAHVWLSYYAEYLE